MDILSIIQFENESTYVDFKKEQYRHPESLLKDIMAIANADIESDKRYIIVGVKLYPNGEREYHPIPSEEFKDDAEYQQLIRQNIEPEIKFKYFPVVLNEMQLGVFEIMFGDQRPYVMKKKFGNLEQGIGYIRRGSQQERFTRADIENIYEVRYRKQKERDIKYSYLHLLKYEFRNNRTLLWNMESYVTEGPTIDEIWTTAGEIANHFVFEAWDSLMRSGIIASLDFDEMEKYRYAIKTIRDAIYYVKEAQANWKRLLRWKNIGHGGNAQEIQPSAPPQLILQRSVQNCRDGIKIAREAIDAAVALLEQRHFI